MVSHFALLLFATTYCAISIKIIRLRKQKGVAVGYGDSKTIERYVGASRNFFEYSLIFLLLLFVLEQEGIENLEFLLLIFVIGRVLHFLSVTKIEPESIRAGSSKYSYRIFGMSFTFLAIFSAMIILAFHLIF